MIDLPRFLAAKEPCILCDHKDTEMISHALDTERADSVVRVKYRCNRCMKIFGIEFSGGYVTTYVTYLDKVRAEISSGTSAIASA